MKGKQEYKRLIKHSSRTETVMLVMAAVIKSLAFTCCREIVCVCVCVLANSFNFCNTIIWEVLSIHLRDWETGSKSVAHYAKVYS